MWKVTLMVGLLEREAFLFNTMERASAFAECVLEKYLSVGDDFAVVIRRCNVQEQGDENS